MNTRLQWWGGLSLGILLATVGICSSAEASKIVESTVEGSEIPAEGWSIQEGLYTGEIEGDVVRLTAELNVKILRDGLQEIPLDFGSATVTEVKLSGSGVLVVHNDQYAIAVQKRGTCRVTVKLSTLLQRDHESEGFSMDIPQALFSKLALTIPRTDVELAPEDALTVTKEVKAGRVILSASLGIARSINLRWTARPIQQEVVEPAYQADARVLATIQEESLRTFAVLKIHVLQGQYKELSFNLPAGASVISVRGQDWKVSSTEQGQRVKVTFSEPLKVGVTSLILEMEQPLGESNSEVILPVVVPVEAKRLTGYLVIANGTSLELQNLKAEGLHRIDVRELPPDLVGMSASPAVAAFRYQEAPYRISVSIHRPEEMAVLVAIAEYGHLATIVSPNGERITRAVYQVRNNKKPWLEVALPDQATLWSVLVNQRAVKPAVGEHGRVRIPLVATRGPEETFPVEVVYVEKGSVIDWVGQERFRGPTLDIPVTVISWSLYLPEEMWGLRFSGNLQRHLKVAGFLPDVSTIVTGGTVARFERQADAAEFAGGRMAQAKTSLRAAASQSDSYNYGAPAALEAASVAAKNEEMDDLRKMAAQVQEVGVLPFRIAIPQSGRAHRFSRLLTTGEVLRMDVRYMKVPTPAVPWAAGSLGLMGLAGFGGGLKRFLRRRKTV